MKLALVTTDFAPAPGGIATLLAGWARGCSERCGVTVLAPATPGDQGFDVRQPYEIVRVTGGPGVREARFLKHLLDLDRRDAFDLVACASWFTPGFVGYLVHVMRNTPYVVWAHGSEVVDDWLTVARGVKSLLRPLKKVVFGKCNAVVTLSQYTKGLLAAQGIPAHRIRVIPPGVDTARFTPRGAAAAVARYRRGARHVLLTVARLDPHKGHARVLEALATDLSDLDGICYLIAGSGPEEPRLRRLASSFGLEARVEFLGYVPDEDLPDLYRAADVFVMPSGVLRGRLDYVEGFGISYLEASACGRPIVGGRSGGVGDAVVDGVTGLLVDPNDVAQIGRAIRALILDPTRAALLGRAGRERVLSHLSLERFAERFIELACDGAQRNVS